MARAGVAEGGAGAPGRRVPKVAAIGTVNRYRTRSGALTDFGAHRLIITLNNCADDGRSATGNTQTPRADAHLLELFDRARGITRSLARYDD
jgi:hypothetical protein